jgi:integrase
MHVEQLPSGSWRVTVRTPGRRRTATATTKKKAVQLGHTLAHEMGNLPRVHTVDVAGLLARWQAGADLSVTYRADAERVIERLPEPFLASLVDDVDVALVELLYEQLTREGWSPHRIARAHAVMSSAWTMARRYQWVVANPFSVAKKPAPARPQLHPPSPKQIAALLDAADERFALYLEVSAAVGARRGEVVGLQWGDVTDEALIVRRSLSYAPGQGVVVTEGKTGPKGHRVVAIDPTLAAALKVHRVAQVELALASGMPSPCWVFSHNAGATPWRPDFASREFLRLRRRVGIDERIRLHDLRHYVATQLLAAGVPLSVVGKRLGHRQLATTSDTYGDYVPAADQAAAAVMAGLRGKRSS